MSRFASRTALLLGLVLLSPRALAQAGAPVPPPQDKHQRFGAFAAPAGLPPGSAAAYAYFGVPEVGAGYRQGLGGVDLDLRVGLDYLQLAFALVADARLPLIDEGKLQIAPSAGVGVVFDTGARYFDTANFRYLGLRLIPGAHLSYRIAETVSLIGELAVPIDFSLGPSGGSRFRPLLGGGAELYLGNDLTVGLVAQGGLDVLKEPLGVAQSRFGYALRVGIGYRFF